MRILIVSPHFPPTNAADMQRVRLVLPYLRENSIHAEVLCVNAKSVAAPRDPWLMQTIPHDVPVHRVGGMSLTWSRIPGLGTLSNRAYNALKRKGNQTLAAGKFDLVYFSTTQFGVHSLGPYWKRRFGVPFVMDYQDPWVNDYYREHPAVVPPGGRLKYAVVHRLSEWSEPRVLRHCSGITSVSQAYPEALHTRYPGIMSRMQSLVIPFPGDDRDFDLVRKNPQITQSVFNSKDGYLHWVYIGRGGVDMHQSVRALFEALAKYRVNHAEEISRLRIHFIGTSYARIGAGTKSIEPLAAEFGLDDIVIEQPDRIPYSETARCLLDADSLLVLGSNDTGYTPSKVYPYLLSRKPLLVVLHRQSPAVGVIEKTGGARVIAFDSCQASSSIAESIQTHWLEEKAYLRTVPVNDDQLSLHTAANQAMQLAEFWKASIGKTNTAV